MLLSRALFLASAATAVMAYQLDRRQSDQNIPDDESFCECIDKDHFPDDTLTQAVCRQYPNGDFAVFESGRVGLNLVGACFNYDFQNDLKASTEEFTKKCQETSKQCKYVAWCFYGSGGENANWISEAPCDADDSF